MKLNKISQGQPRSTTVAFVTIRHKKTELEMVVLAAKYHEAVLDFDQQVRVELGHNGTASP